MADKYKYKYITLGVWIVAFALFVAFGMYNENKPSTITEHISNNAKRYVTQVRKFPKPKIFL